MARQGFNGPAPKRAEERRRRNKDVDLKVTPKTYGNIAAREDNFDPSWHPAAQLLYRSFSDSPVSLYFEPSDWATLRIVIESASASLLRYEDRVSLDMVGSVIKGLEEFLATEATRRRLRIETEPQEGARWHEPEEYWHPLATAWYESLQRSGQSSFYQASDIAFAFFMAEVITRYLGAGLKMSGRLLDVILKGCTLLLATEASRRIAQMELTKIESRNIDAEITALMEEYAAAI
ncbi:hypothetical protein [Streptomyces yunnanensis]|uniref:Uncharacterized protein n=1 Tax=Streptomyces yunnanensis TaxID=156453 RepID=A0A9X8N7W7_9ACTN|nr:hypothetical protein [Streptomyces yunnanensis]SHN24643.1 hypothetical protein SAMN05216268_126122 [Streptomyces yunnanensis]